MDHLKTGGNYVLRLEELYVDYVLCSLDISFLKQHIIYLCKTTSSALKTRSNKEKNNKNQVIKIVDSTVPLNFRTNHFFRIKIHPHIHYLYQTKGRDNYLTERHLVVIVFEHLPSQTSVHFF